MINNIDLTAFLKNVINDTEIGIIYIDQNDIIIDFNTCAMEQLKLKKSQVGNNISITNMNECLSEGSIYNVEIAEKQYLVVGDIYKYDNMPYGYKQILIFNSIKVIKSKTLNYNSEIPFINLDSIIGESETIKKIKANIKKVANSASGVCITGESGTGKSLIAKSIHNESNRSDKPFVYINCGATLNTAIESELFGYVKGGIPYAYDKGKIGKFELANKGILFLDEIDAMPLFMQTKLLRVLRDRTMTRIGGKQIIPLDIRIIVATGKDLKQMVAENKFIEDLYYRIYTFPIELPPLRERKEDIPLLIKYFMNRYNALYNKNIHTVTDEVYKAFYNYDWCGNIKELENVIEILVSRINACEIIDISMLPAYFKNKEFISDGDKNNIRRLTEIEDEYIKKALDIYGWDTKGKKMAAEKLGIGIATLYRKTKYMD